MPWFHDAAPSMARWRRSYPASTLPGFREFKGETMKNLFAAAVLAATISGAGAAGAMPLAPLGAADTAGVIQVAQRRRDPGGAGLRPGLGPWPLWPLPPDLRAASCLSCADLSRAGGGGPAPHLPARHFLARWSLLALSRPPQTQKTPLARGLFFCAEMMVVGAGHRIDGPAPADHIGMLSCFLTGSSIFLSRSIAKARAIRRRVECGMITSSI